MRYQRLGFSLRDLNIEAHLKSLELDLQELERKGEDWFMAMPDVSFACDLLALCYYFCEDLPSAKRYAAMVSQYCAEYFFGSWRKEVPIDNDPPSEAVRKRYEPWACDFRNSVMWAMCLGDWRKVRKLSEYPTDECPIGRYETRQECHWLIALAAVLRGDKTQQDKYFNIVRKCRSKYYKQLLTMLEAILAGDVAGYEKGLASHLAYCCKEIFNQLNPRVTDIPSRKNVDLHQYLRDFVDAIAHENTPADESNDGEPTPNITNAVSKDGTILHQYARHLGLKVSWPQEHADRLISL